MSALIAAGLRIDWFREHDTVVWAMFKTLIKRGRSEYEWPDRPWFPLSFSLRAAKSESPAHAHGGLAR
jgi:hypothetical protein